MRALEHLASLALVVGFIVALVLILRDDMPPAPPGVAATAPAIAHDAGASPLPVDCVEYIALVRLVASCQAVPSDAVKSLEQTIETVENWPDRSPAALESLRVTCRHGVEALATAPQWCAELGKQ